MSDRNKYTVVLFGTPDKNNKYIKMKWFKEELPDIHLINTATKAVLKTCLNT